jgi:hypothetical protein
MMNPDQMYTLRQLRHSDLRAEAERARVQRTCWGKRTAWSRAWLATWLRRLSTRWTRGVILTGRAASNTPSRTI